MKIKPIKQKDSISCGPASIKMAVDYLGIPLPLKLINEISGYQKKGGLYNKDLIAALKALNIKVKEIRKAAWADLIRHNTKDKVIIVSWMLKGYIGHFSVVEKATTNAIHLADPESGTIIKMDKLVFLRLWLDYDPKWYPEKNTDINLRWMAVISK